MRKSVLTLLASTALATGLTGCVLAPQTIELSESYEIEQPAASVSRGALIRVVDNREEISSDERQSLGSRGGRLAENSPLYVFPINVSNGFKFYF